MSFQVVFASIKIAIDRTIKKFDRFKMEDNWDINGMKSIIRAVTMSSLFELWQKIPNKVVQIGMTRSNFTDFSPILKDLNHIFLVLES